MRAQSATTSVRDELSKDKIENQRHAPYPFTQLPNALYALLPQLNGSETKLLWVILRHTFGFQAHDRPAAISLSKFERETGLTRETVSKALHALLSRGIVERYGEGTQKARFCVIMPGPALVGKSDQALVRKSDPPLVGKFGDIKESSSVKRIPAKENSSRRSAGKAGANAFEGSASFLHDDDVARLSKPRPCLSAEQELAEFVRERTGSPIHGKDLRRIKENLELRNTNLESFVDEVRLHGRGDLRNPIGFLLSLSMKTHWHAQRTIPPQAISTDSPQKCRCSWGYSQRNPDAFCNACSLGLDLANQAQRDQKRKAAAVASAGSAL
jgi:hypothetical protein